MNIKTFLNISVETLYNCLELRVHHFFDTIKLKFDVSSKSITHQIDAERFNYTFVVAPYIIINYLL